MKFKILARHKWVGGAKITESVCRDGTIDDPLVHRFTATIRGYRNWKIYQGVPTPDAVDFVIDKVKKIRDRIDAGDESVFNEPNEFEITKNVVHEDDLCQCGKLKSDWRSHCDNCNALGDLDALADGLPQRSKMTTKELIREFIKASTDGATYSDMHALGFCRATLRRWVAELERDGAVKRVRKNPRERARFWAV